MEDFYKMLVLCDFRCRESKNAILKTSVKGLTAAVEKFKERSTLEPKVKVQIELTEAGLISINEATAFFEITQGSETLTGRLVNSIIFPSNSFFFIRQGSIFLWQKDFY
jgi:hypothetical protein